MESNFFKLKKPTYKKVEDSFKELLQSSDSIHSIWYKPNLLDHNVIDSYNIEDTTFKNVSFSKTKIKNINFNNCEFKNCLFIATTFVDNEFHLCNFENCNFHKVEFKNIYAKPAQFDQAIKDTEYANIAVHLYQELRKNYNSNYQREFKYDIEYNFQHWRTINDFQVARKYNQGKFKSYLQYIRRWLYEKLFGYGYKTKNYFITTLSLITLITTTNYFFTNYLFHRPVEPSIFKSIYFTITTMATLGSDGYSPNTELGYFFILLNVIVGITVLTTSINTIFKGLNK